MKEILFIFILLFGGPFSVNVHASSISKRQELKLVLEKELITAKKLSDDFKNKNTGLLLRIMEIEKELYKVVLEDENQKFLQNPDDKGNASHRDEYFKKSKSLYINIMKNGKMFHSRFPDSPVRTQVFLIMAELANEYSDKELVKKLILSSLKLEHKSDFKVSIEAYDLLASIYFNQKKL